MTLAFKQTFRYCIFVILKMILKTSNIKRHILQLHLVSGWILLVAYYLNFIFGGMDRIYWKQSTERQLYRRDRKKIGKT